MALLAPPIWGEGQLGGEGFVAEARGGGSRSIFSSGSDHVTGVTSLNVVVGGGGERSRRSRRKDGGAVEEALPLLLPPLLPPQPAKPELEPQRGCRSECLTASPRRMALDGH